MQAMNYPRQTLVIHAVREAAIFERIASCLRRRGFMVASMSMGDCERRDYHRMTVVIEGNRGDADRARLFLGKIVGVIRVRALTAMPNVSRRLGLIKLRCSTESRHQIVEICQIFRARVVDLGLGSMIVEITGSSEKIGQLVKILEPFGVQEVAQTGELAMIRDNASEGSPLAAQPAA